MKMNWVITNTDYYLSADGETDVIYCLHWTCSDTQDGFTGSVYSTQAVSYTVGTPFTPYDSVTQAMMVEWLKDAMGAEAVAATEAAVQSQINAQKNPTTGSGLPPSAQ
jgi:hypothetical protein